MCHPRPATRGIKMATDKPKGENARKGAVKKRTQRKRKMGKASWAQRDK